MSRRVSQAGRDCPGGGHRDYQAAHALFNIAGPPASIPAGFREAGGGWPVNACNIALSVPDENSPSANTTVPCLPAGHRPGACPRAGGRPCFLEAFQRATIKRADIGTIRRRYTRTVAAGYVANGCAQCDKLQGRFFVEEIRHADMKIAGTVKTPID